ncbi:MAG: bifunctional hydroxymethylpyrimidine kinase/phosphomethylpyrimidine kinase [Deltaproteobacteria bacterium]|nr:bifunctional hydroxymethylpyrimidine kinase/phosphomethylpyrimidine kinase [Deltaproteobacteria bacterium]
MTAWVALCGGLDPAGQAGLAADLHACFALGARGMPIACGRTAQSDGQFTAAWATHTAELAIVLAAITSPSVCAIKTGMLGSVPNLRAVAAWARSQGVPLVVDPLGRTTSGGWLYPKDQVDTVRKAMLRDLLPAATVVTPNWHELAWLSGREPARTERELATQAALLPCPAWIKGGHAPHPALARDWLWTGSALGARPIRPPWPGTPRGTGCRLATAIAIGLGQGKDLEAAGCEAEQWLDAWARRLPMPTA